MEEMGGWDGLSRRSRPSGRKDGVSGCATPVLPLLPPPPPGGALIPDCTRAPAQVCPLLINDV